MDYEFKVGDIVEVVTKQYDTPDLIHSGLLVEIISLGHDAQLFRITAKVVTPGTPGWQFSYNPEDLSKPKLIMPDTREYLEALTCQDSI